MNAILWNVASTKIISFGKRLPLIAHPSHTVDVKKKHVFQGKIYFIRHQTGSTARWDRQDVAWAAASAQGPQLRLPRKPPPPGLLKATRNLSAKHFKTERNNILFFHHLFLLQLNSLNKQWNINRMRFALINSWHCYLDLFPYNERNSRANSRFYSVQWHFLEEVPNLIKWRNISSSQHKALCLN